MTFTDNCDRNWSLLHHESAQSCQQHPDCHIKSEKIMIILVKNQTSKLYRKKGTHVEAKRVVPLEQVTISSSHHQSLYLEIFNRFEEFCSFISPYYFDLNGYL